MLQNSIHIWITDIEKIDDPYMLDVYRSILSPDEIQRCERLVKEQGRASFLIAHAMVRSVLSNYVEIAPKDLQFKSNANGKPKVFCEQGRPLPLEYNLSHSGRYAVMVVTNEIDCGIDVEKIDSGRDYIEIAENTFSVAEMIDLQSVGEEEQAKRFYTYWTLKEAYIKAKSETIASSLNKISFDLHHQNQISVKLDNSGDEYKNWQFHTQLLDQEYILALALQHNSPFDIKIELFETIPMQVFG
ncbi:MAG: 4'-phosphopantetheinyl transferase superfamily protein [Gammaproteobacteria bacterium]|nr:MAG: 4'-phosphopantetheinyl transferase superfamily protein [Gammaproteobacteria bacterium]